MIVTQVGKLIKVFGDCIIGSDLHIPEHDIGCVKEWISEGKRTNIRSLIINGDAWDMIKFSKHGEASEQSWKKLKKVSKEVFKEIFSWFNQVVITMGNHDEWLKFITRKQLSMEDFVELCIEKPPWVELWYTDWDFCILNDNIRVCHSKNYSRRPHQAPELLGKKYRMSCIQAHDHMCAYKSVTKNGKTRYYINMGCALDYDKAEYEMGSSTLYGNWGKGFVVVMDGTPRVITHENMISFKSYKEVVEGTENGYCMIQWERSDR